MNDTSLCQPEQLHVDALPEEIKAVLEMAQS